MRNEYKTLYLFIYNIQYILLILLVFEIFFLVKKNIHTYICNYKYVRKIIVY